MKSVLISIQPKWCELIASGKKTVEVRKTVPKLELPFKCYIYCTAGAPWLVYGDRFDGGSFNPEYTTTHGWSRKEADEIWGVMNGKVIGEFVCDKIFDICIEISKPDDLPGYPFPCTGLMDKEILQYLGNGKTGYGWHISNLVIYDEPKDLAEFWSADKCPYASKDGCTYEYHCFRAGQTKRCGSTLQRPPQSWCYVEEA